MHNQTYKQLTESWQRHVRLDEMNARDLNFVLDFMKKATPEDYEHFDHLFGAGNWRTALPFNYDINKLDAAALKALSLDGISLAIKTMRGSGWSVDWKEKTATRSVTSKNPKTGEEFVSKQNVKVGKLLPKLLTIWQRLKTDPDKVPERDYPTVYANYMLEINKFYKVGADLTAENYEKMLANMIDTAIYEAEEALNWWKINSEKVQKFYIIISRHPIDVLRMSDFKGVQSCHSQGGMYYHCAIQEAQATGFVFFLIDQKSYDMVKGKLQDDEIFVDKAGSGPKHGHTRDIEGITPITRGRVREFLNPGRGYSIALPEKKVYGTKVKGVLAAVTKWLKALQDPHFPQTPEDIIKDEWYLQGGTYSDAGDPGAGLETLFSRYFDLDIGFYDRDNIRVDELPPGHPEGITQADITDFFDNLAIKTEHIDLEPARRYSDAIMEKVELERLVVHARITEKDLGEYSWRHSDIQKTIVQLGAGYELIHGFEKVMKKLALPVCTSVDVFKTGEEAVSFEFYLSPPEEDIYEKCGGLLTLEDFPCLEKWAIELDEQIGNVQKELKQSIISHLEKKSLIVQPVMDMADFIGGLLEGFGEARLTNFIMENDGTMRLRKQLPLMPDTAGLSALSRRANEALARHVALLVASGDDQQAFIDLNNEKRIQVLARIVKDTKFKNIGDFMFSGNKSIGSRRWEIDRGKIMLAYYDFVENLAASKTKIQESFRFDSKSLLLEKDSENILSVFEGDGELLFFIPVLIAAVANDKVWLSAAFSKAEYEHLLTNMHSLLPKTATPEDVVPIIFRLLKGIDSNLDTLYRAVVDAAFARFESLIENRNHDQLKGYLEIPPLKNYLDA